MPNVPNVVGNPPHLRILAHFFELLDRSGTGRKTQHDWPSRFLECVANHAYLFSAIRVAADAVYFDKIHTRMVKELEWIEMAQLAVSSILFKSLSLKLR
jgi:hypothetical protein